MIESRVDIIDDRTREVIGCCHGPTLADTCSQTGRSMVVACAGRRVSMLGGGPENWLLVVPPRARRCPLTASLEIS